MICSFQPCLPILLILAEEKAGPHAGDLIKGVAEGRQTVEPDAIGDVGDGIFSFHHQLDGHDDAVGAHILHERHVKFGAQVTAEGPD